MASSDADLQAVESALDTLVLAESHKSLQKVVTRLLPALLAALSTKSQPALAKCIEALSHMNTRIRAAPNLSLPFEQVLQVAIDPAAAVMTRNVAIQGGYVERCFMRLSDSQRASHLPWLVQAAATVPSQPNQDALHSLALIALRVASAALPRSNSDDLWRLLSDVPLSAVHSFFDYSLRALRRKVATSKGDLLAIVRLTSEYAGIKMPQRAVKVFPHFLLAAGSVNNSDLIAAGEDAMKRVDTCDVLAASDPTIVDKLFELFRDPLAEIPLRIVLLSKGLLRVTLGASCFPEVMDVINISLFTPGIPARFQALGMQFVSFVISHCTADTLKTNASQLVVAMKKLIDNATDGQPSFPDKVQAFGFTGLAELLLREPSLLGTQGVTHDLFFEAAQSRQISAESRSAVSHALVALTRVVYCSHSDTSDRGILILQTLRSTVLNIEDTAISARLAAVQWANECFGFANPDARLINIIAAGDRDSNIRQAALQGLLKKRWKPKTSFVDMDVDESPDSAFPDFSTLVSTFETFGEANMNPKSTSAYLKFALAVLKDSMAEKGRVDVLHADEVDNYFESHPREKASLLHVLNTANNVLLSRNKPELALERAALSIVLFVSNVKFLKASVSETYIDRIDNLIAQIVRKSAEGDTTVARALSVVVGITSESFPEQKLLDLIQRTGAGLEPNESGTASGRDGEDDRVAKILCIGQVVSRYCVKSGLNGESNPPNVISSVCLNITRRVTLAVESSNTVRVAACIALSDMGVEGPLPISQSARAIAVSSLGGLLKLQSTEGSVVEAASNAIGKICVGEPRSSFKSVAVEALLCIGRERKEDEIRFSAAESLVRCASNFDAPSPVLMDSRDSNTTAIRQATETEELQTILQMKINSFRIRKLIIDDVDGADAKVGLKGIVKQVIQLCFDERPTARNGGCVFLFTFLRLLGAKPTENNSSQELKLNFVSSTDEGRFKENQKVISFLLPEAQHAFTVLLSDRSDFVQQLSSCGIALVYEMCPPKEQRDLVTVLVRSLTSGKSRAASIVPGDQGALLDLNGVNVKEQGQAGKSATYRELCSLAQDMGQPELVYKFMDLAGHTALWNSRKGAALAGSALLGSEIAAEQLRPHVKSLLPRLYVYCYDPTESVRISMGSVLSAVVKASGLGTVAEAVSKNFDDIVEYCLKSITSRQWRVREGACGALRDLLSGLTWEKAGNFFGEFWYITLRAMDDIKESVRKAAEGTGRALSELSIHLCDPALVGVEIASKAVTILIPGILPAFTHGVEEIRKLATTTLSKVIRFGGDALKGSIPDLVEALLEAATELEPQVLNYAQFHVESPDELEALRTRAATMSSSPLIDSLERLAGLVDEKVMEQVVPKMTRMARVGVGIPTRAATARFFATILRSRAVIAEPYAPRLMQAASAAAGMERNALLRKSWCSAVGAGAKLSPSESVAKLCREIANNAGSEDLQQRLLASCLAAGIWKISPDTGRKHGSVLLPVAYMGRYETDEDAGETESNWSEVWNEGAPSTEAGLRLYAKEITEICTHRLGNSSQYRVKRSAAASLGALAKASHGTVDVVYVDRAAVALVQSLPGHIWEGKMAAVEALGEIASSYETLDVWTGCGGADVVVRALLQEGLRGKSEYRIAAMRATALLLDKCHDGFDLFNEVMRALGDYWSGARGSASASEQVSASRVVWETGSDANAVDARNRARKAEKQLRIVSVRCLEASIGNKVQRAEVEQFVSVVECVVGIDGDWDVELGMVSSMRRVWDRVDGSVLKCGSTDKHPHQLVSRVVRLAGIGVASVKHAVLRRAGLSLMLSIGQRVDDKAAITAWFTDDVRHAIIASREDSDPGVQTDAKKVYTFYNL